MFFGLLRARARGDGPQELGVSLARDDAPSTSHYTFDADGAILGFFGEAFGRATREEARARSRTHAALAGARDS